jgi:hypothetical protein
MKIKTQTKEQFIMLHGNQDKQSRTAKACFDVIFGNEHRIIAAKRHGITEQTISMFIRTNSYKHADRYQYINKGSISLEGSTEHKESAVDY